MDYPVFMDIEFSSAEDGQFPTIVSWSLPEGTLKSVLILPADEWDPWNNVDSNVDIQHLFDQGVTPTDIAREINDDLGGKTVFVDGLDADEALLEKLFDACGSDPDFELASLSQFDSSYGLEELLELRNDYAEQNELNPAISEDNVRAMLFMSQNI